MVRLYKELFGRWPTKAHRTYATPDIVLCTVEDSLTGAERKPVELGEHQALRDTRMLFQHVYLEPLAPANDSHMRPAQTRV